jgi:hypothetical protein
MVIGVYAHKLTEPSSSPKFAELADKAYRVFCQTNDSPINVDDEGVRSVNFGAGRKADIWIKKGNEKQLIEICHSRLPSTPNMCAIRITGCSSTSVVMCVMRAKFFTNPHASPSGVSLGQSTPH